MPSSLHWWTTDRDERCLPKARIVHASGVAPASGFLFTETRYPWVFSHATIRLDPGGDCIDDADALRAGGTVGVLGCVVKASSTLGTFLRSMSVIADCWLSPS